MLSDAFRERIWDMGARPAIPVKRRDAPVACHKWAYRCRHLKHLGSPQRVARCRYQIRKNSNLVPNCHPYRCPRRLNQDPIEPSRHLSSPT